MKLCKLSFLAALLLAFALHAIDGVTENGLEYVFTNAGTEVQICPSTLLSGAIVIPDTIEGRPVTSLAAGAFASQITITSITIPASVTSIGPSAFYKCVKLKSLTIPEGVTAISTETFKDCTSLTQVNLPTHLSHIGNSAFEGCTKLKSIAISDDLGAIPYRAFADCASLASITLPANLIEIDDCVFQGCVKLKSITIPDGVTKIGNYAFDGCTALATVHLSNRLTTLGYATFRACTALATITIPDGVTYIPMECFTASGLKSITLPENGALDTIPSRAFADCKKLTSITIPATVTDFGVGAFAGCTALKSITFDGMRPTLNGEQAPLPAKCVVRAYASNGWGDAPSILDTTVTFIEPEVFYSVTDEGVVIRGLTKVNATSVSIPPMLEKRPVVRINEYAFRECFKLKSVRIPATVTTIGGSAFADCPALATVSLANGLDTIDAYAFTGCAKLKSITLPDTLTTIGTYAFADCTSLASITIPASTDHIDDNPFAYCKALKKITVAPGNQEYVVIGGLLITYDGNNVIAAPGALAGTATVPAGVKRIRYSAFAGCAKLKSVILPDSLQRIDQSAFDSCAALAAVTIPKGVTHVEYLAFGNCKSLKTFAVAAGNGSFTVKNGLLMTKDGKQVVAAPGALAGTVTVPDGTEHILACAFMDCAKIKSVILPNSLQEIQYGAFYGCKSLASLAIPAGVQTIGQYAFYDCKALKKLSVAAGSPYFSMIGGALYQKNAGVPWYLRFVPLSFSGILDIPQTVAILDPYVCCGCTKLTGAILPSGLTTIPESCFEECTALAAIIVPEGVTVIDDYAFEYCKKLASVALPSSLQKIGVGAFYGCTSLTRITLPQGLKTILGSSFEGCSKLASITIPSSVETLKWHAFDNCKKLLDIYFFGLPATLEQETDLQAKTVVHAPWMGTYGTTPKGVPIRTTLFYAPERSLVISGPQTITPNGKFQYTATINGAAVAATWSIVSNTKFAKVDKNGLVTIGKTTVYQPVFLRAFTTAMGYPLEAFYTLRFAGQYDAPAVLDATHAATSTTHGFTLEWEGGSLHVVATPAEAALLLADAPDARVALLEEAAWTIDLPAGATLRASDAALLATLPDGTTIPADGFTADTPATITITLP